MFAGRSNSHQRVLSTSSKTKPIRHGVSGIIRHQSNAFLLISRYFKLLLRILLQNVALTLSVTEFGRLDS